MTAATISIDRLLALILGLSYKPYCDSKASSQSCYYCLAGILFSWPLTLDWFGYSIAYGYIICCSLYFSFLQRCSRSQRSSLKLRQQQAQVQQRVEQEQVNGGEIPLNIARYKKMVHTVAWLQVALIVCYMPSLTVILLRIVTQRFGNLFLYYSAITVLFTNSSVNPILYCWRIGEIKKEVGNTLKKICQRSST